MKVFYNSLLLFIALAPLTAAAQVSTNVTYPAVGVWNGYNSHFNVVECINFLPEALTLRVTVKDPAAAEIGISDFSVPSLGTRHLILNSFAINDNYGTYVIEPVDETLELAGKLRCFTAIYRFSQPGADKAVEYAFSIPVENPLTGTNYGFYNSFDPSAGSNPVFNWLTIYNPGEIGEASLTVQVNAYDQLGALDNTFVVADLAAGDRRDIALGHDRPANAGQLVGIYEIVPSDTEQPYGAFVTRYSALDGMQFRFAFPLFASRGDCGGEPVFASTTGLATNWAEIANVGSDSVTATVRILSAAGEERGSEIRTLAPYSQQHILLNTYLEEGEVGHFTVDCAEPNSSVLAQSLFYGQTSDTDPSIAWAYGSQGGYNKASKGTRLAFPLNTFLGAANWLKTAKPLSGNTSTINAQMFDDSGTQQNYSPFLLSPGGAFDLSIHNALGQDVIGAASVKSDTATTPFYAELLRVFPSTSGTIGYIMQIPPGRVTENVPELELEQIVSGLTSPVGLVHAGDGSGRLFILEKGGLVKILDGAQVLEDPFLDLSAEVSELGEQGLLGLAFHPSYTANKRLFVHFNDSNGTSIIREYLVSEADANLVDTSTAKTILTLEQPSTIHNGGPVIFGPDGLLYIAFGDGGPAEDPDGNGQNRQTLLGSILRIDVDSGSPYAIPEDNPFVSDPDSRPEIYAYGLRNPWRASFSKQGRLVVTDVGQNAREELNVITAGGNYGWKVFEGTSCFKAAPECQTVEAISPVSEYSHSDGRTAIGGYVYCGSDIAELSGKYIMGDFTSGKIWMLDESSTTTWLRTEVYEDSQLFITSFGEDEGGELYIVSFLGKVFRIRETT